jgi:hypothetical protein
MKRYAAIYFGMISVFFAIVKSEAQSTDSRLNVLLAIDESQFAISDTQPSDTLITMLMSLDLSQYSGQPVDTLLAHLPSGIINMKITGWRSIRRAEILHIVYPNKVVVEIHVKHFQYMNPNWVTTTTPAQHWSVTLFKKETIAHAVIFNGSVCINGCDKEYK